MRPLPIFLVLALAGCRSAAPGSHAREEAHTQVLQALDALHMAASQADGETYFALFAPDAVYMGTDAGERWSVDEFRAYAEPYFSAGRGWTYHAVERHVALGPRLELAWFDEHLENASYGTCRGTGVLERRDGAWRFAQYSLSLPVPNELARDLVERIRALEPGAGAPGEAPASKRP